MDQGHSKDKYFILKSVGKSVIRNSFGDGTYSVQPAVGARLNRAFAKSRQQNGSVYVIVSTKRSKAFQGLGKMTEAAQVEPNGPRLRFSIEWLSGFVNIPFSHVEHIKQRVNSNFSVTASQDGQEIGGRAGKQLSSLLTAAVPEEDIRREQTPAPPRKWINERKEDGKPEKLFGVREVLPSEKEKEEVLPTKEKEEEKKEEETSDLPTFCMLERFAQYPPTLLPQLLQEISSPSSSSSSSPSNQFLDWSGFEVYFRELFLHHMEDAATSI